METNPKIDEYISKSPDFAKPILQKLRNLVYQAHPEIKESIKWGMPNFEYKGLLVNMAAFKNHCSFGFWKSKLIAGLINNNEGMGNFGKIKSLADLPSDKILIKHLKTAISLNEKGIDIPKMQKQKEELIVPENLTLALNKNSKAKQVFKKEYIDWIIEAKRDETKIKRIKKTLEWLSEGKHRNWKYDNC